MIIASRLDFSQIARAIAKPLAILFAWDVLVAVLYLQFGLTQIAVEGVPLTLAGSALALLITLRNNNAYARWWEARQLWGSITNSSRTLARQLNLFLPAGADVATMTRMAIAYVHALRCHLRRQPPWEEIAPFLAPEVAARLRGFTNVPNAILGRMAAELETLARSARLDSVRLAAIDATMAVLTNMQGGCERIKNTPMPPYYTLVPRLFVRLICILLPFAMVADLRWLTPLGSAFLGFFFLMLDNAGAAVEHPFENAETDVPLSAITRTIEIDLRQALGDEDVPEPLQPIDEVLW